MVADAAEAGSDVDRHLQFNMDAAEAGHTELVMSPP
jgi:hypothetical protein